MLGSGNAGSTLCVSPCVIHPDAEKDRERGFMEFTDTFLTVGHLRKLLETPGLSDNTIVQIATRERTKRYFTWLKCKTYGIGLARRCDGDKFILDADFEDDNEKQYVVTQVRKIK